MTPNESPNTKAGVPVHLSTPGQHHHPKWRDNNGGSRGLGGLCVCAIKTGPIANDGERRARRSSPTTVELAAPPQSKRKEKKSGHYKIYYWNLNQMIQKDMGSEGTDFTSTGRRCRHRLRFCRPVRGRTVRCGSRSRRKRPLQCTADATRSSVSCAIRAASPVCTPDTSPFKQRANWVISSMGNGLFENRRPGRNRNNKLD